MPTCSVALRCSVTLSCSVVIGLFIRTAHMNAYEAMEFIESFPAQVLQDIKNIDFASAVRDAIRFFDDYELPEETKMSGAAYGRKH